MLIVIGWFIWSVVNVAIADSNRRSTAGVFFASILFSPLLVFLYLLAVGKNDVAPPVQVVAPPVEPVKPIKPTQKVVKSEAGISTLNVVAIWVVSALIIIVVVALFSPYR
jgi:hypothetical protein